MKKQLQILITAITLVFLQSNVVAQRYLNEVFPTHSLTSNIVYGQNITILPGTPTMSPLLMDIYQPAGMPDPLTQRPLVILIHTGSFLPPVINGQPTGSKTDSSIVEFAKQFARRGYVAASMTYRMGWKPDAPGGPGQDIRTGTLLQAVYRSIQDAKACVRWFKADADTGSNIFGVDTTKIILVGQGTGGYIAQAYATLDDPAEIALPKFLSATTDPTWGFVAGQPYVNQAVLGDFEGYGGNPALNYPDNHPGHTTNVQFVVNLGGALGDSSWMEPGDPPFVGFHPVGDPFAPFYIGDVIVPTTGDFVVEVSGSGHALELANNLGNNNCMVAAAFTDPLTLYANSVNNGNEGLYPLFMTPAMQAGPWEWFDSVATVTYASFLPPPYNTQGGVAYSNSLQTNPNMSKAKALAYIDTIMDYTNPRIVACIPLITGINNDIVKSAGLQVMPVPADDHFMVKVLNQNSLIRSVSIMDIAGKEVRYYREIDALSLRVDRSGLPPGIYVIRVSFDEGSAAVRAVFR